MRILIYGINYSPEVAGVGKYTGEMADWLASRGHEIQVVTAHPYYPQWRVFKGYSAWTYRVEQVHQIPVLRCPLWVPSRLTALNRIIHLISFALSSGPIAVWKSLTWRPQIVFVLQPALLCTPAAWLASRLCKAKLWMHVQDFELDAALELGLLKNKILRRFLQAFERFWMRRLDKASTISDHMFEHLLRKGVPAADRVMLRNWVDTFRICPAASPSPFRRQLKLFDDVVALYSGNMGRKQGLEYLIEAAGHLKDHRHIKIILAGDGSMRAALTTLARPHANILFLPLQPAELLNDLLNLADIHLLLQLPRTSDFVMPSKLTGMFASGRPTIATALPDSEIAGVIEGCGVIVAPENSHALAAAILKMAEETDARRRLGLRAREVAVSLWDKQNILDEFEGHLVKRPLLKPIKSYAPSAR